MKQQPEHIGCIDGSTIVLSRQADDIVLTFGATEARLSKTGATLLSRLLESHVGTVVPPVVQPPVGPRRRETIVDLVEEGLLRAGTVIVMIYQGMERYATVTEAGQIDVDGHIESTPSAAGKRITGQACDGWQVWRTRDGLQLAHLRWKLRASHFPEDEHRYAPNTIKEKRRIAVGWVDYALGEGLASGVRNDPGAENYLEVQQLQSGYRYADTTLDSYRRHLRQWFEWCKANKW